MRNWKIVTLLACLNACANHVPADGFVSDSPSGNVATGGRRHRDCAAMDAGADAGAGCDEVEIGGVDDEFNDDGSGALLDDEVTDDGSTVDEGSDDSDNAAGDPGDDGSTDDGSGDDGTSTLESAHVNLGAAKGEPEKRKKATP